MTPAEKFKFPPRLTFSAHVCEHPRYRPTCFQRKGDSMPLFLTQVAYTQEAWQALIHNPQNRIDAIRPAIEKLGGKVISGYFAFGDYDIVAMLELPDNVAAAAIAIAFAAGGACKSVKTTPLLTTAEGIDALKKAAGTGYKPVTAAASA
jgi:uncharacterized protein with GYD domain